MLKPKQLFIQCVLAKLVAMYRKLSFYFLFGISLITSCVAQKIESKQIKIFGDNPQVKLFQLSEVEKQRWLHQDIIDDTIPGISLDKAYENLLKDKENKEIIVAIIDTEIDIEHEDLKDKFWVNKNEIPHNGIDDDANGYVDDVYGWNFIGNKNGENIIYSTLECIRILRVAKHTSKGKENKELITSSTIQEVQKTYDSLLKVAVSDQKYGNFLVDTYPKSKEALKQFFPEEDYTTKQLDSLYKLYKPKDKELGTLIYYMSDYIKYNLTQEWINNYKKKADIKLEKTYNIDYDDRALLGDNPEDLNDIEYGNNAVSSHLDDFYHGTLMAGIIAATRNNGIGNDGIANNVKIMPLAISSNGEEHDKDIALAIRYAVNNGAKVINMSFGKNFSLHPKWVFDAIKYASEKDVLIVTSAGNSAKDLNYHEYFPNDSFDNDVEVSDNFIMVGSTSLNMNEKLLSSYSNYGSIDVDIFAPGEQVYTTLPKNKYRFDSGTSISSAVVSGVAALIKSYYPNLSASEVKEIIMASGIEYPFEAKVPGTKNPEKLLPFKLFSKSGKIVNAYNALLMAESLSKDD